MSITGYFDYNAAALLCREAIEAFESSLACFGNPSSMYILAKDVRWRLSAARQQVAQLIGANPDEIIFTSGETEANTWALKETLLRVLSQVCSDPRYGTGAHRDLEDRTCVRSGSGQVSQRAFAFEATFVTPNWKGLIEPKILKQCLRLHTWLVSVMLVNNEVESIQPIQESAKIVWPLGIHFHVNGMFTTAIVESIAALRRIVRTEPNELAVA